MSKHLDFRNLLFELSMLRVVLHDLGTQVGMRLAVVAEHFSGNDGVLYLTQLLCFRAGNRASGPGPEARFPARKRCRVTKGNRLFRPRGPRGKDIGRLRDAVRGAMLQTKLARRKH